MKDFYHKPTCKRVREIREAQGCSLTQAEDTGRRELLHKAVRDARIENNLRRALHDIINLLPARS